MPTGLGRSLVEVQRCPLRSKPVPTQIGSRQLRSSSAHCAEVGEERRVGKAEVDVEVEAEVVEEKEEDEEEVEEEEEPEQL